MAERRLLHAEALGGAGEVQLLCDGDEVAEMPEFHVLSAVRPLYSGR